MKHTRWTTAAAVESARMDAALHKELLLVCTALGNTDAVVTEDAEGREVVVEKFVRGENCLEWLQDLQR